MRTIQGEFVDKFDDPDQESYENLLDDYNELKDNLVGDSDIDDIETACEELRKLTKKAEIIEDCCHSFRKSYELMMDSVK